MVLIGSGAWEPTPMSRLYRAAYRRDNSSVGQVSNLPDTSDGRLETCPTGAYRYPSSSSRITSRLTTGAADSPPLPACSRTTTNATRGDSAGAYPANQA
jgi:hypothetical protein